MADNKNCIARFYIHFYYFLNLCGNEDAQLNQEQPKSSIWNTKRAFFPIMHCFSPFWQASLNRVNQSKTNTEFDLKSSEMLSFIGSWLNYINMGFLKEMP